MQIRWLTRYRLCWQVIRSSHRAIPLLSLKQQYYIGKYIRNVSLTSFKWNRSLFRVVTSKKVDRFCSTTFWRLNCKQRKEFTKVWPLKWKVKNIGNLVGISLRKFFCQCAYFVIGPTLKMKVKYVWNMAEVWRFDVFTIWSILKTIYAAGWISEVLVGTSALPGPFFASLCIVGSIRRPADKGRIRQESFLRRRTEDVERATRLS